MRRRMKPMHAHARTCYVVAVKRTTVDLTDENYGALVALAMERGARGYSGLINDALEEYLARQCETERRRRRAAALALSGSISEGAAEHMHDVVRELRGSWRDR